jgi:nucleotide-binding universal stress UspA family protein
MVSLKRILVPHDFSETSEAAVNYGTAFARNFGAELHFLHVGDAAKNELDAEFPIGLENGVEDAERERLLKILPPRDQRELRPKLAVRPGIPAAEIVRYARENAVDLIVMGTHGRGMVAHAVMGSVAEKVVRTAPCPVLTVQQPHRTFVQPHEVRTNMTVSA